MYGLRKRDAAGKSCEFSAGPPVQDPEFQFSTDLRLLAGVLHRLNFYLPVLHDQFFHIIHRIRHIEIVIQSHLGRDVPPATVHVDMFLQKFHHKTPPYLSKAML